MPRNASTRRYPSSSGRARSPYPSMTVNTDCNSSEEDYEKSPATQDNPDQWVCQLKRTHKCPWPGCETRTARADNLSQHFRVHLLGPGKRHGRGLDEAVVRDTRPKKAVCSPAPWVDVIPPEDCPPTLELTTLTVDSFESMPDQSRENFSQRIPPILENLLPLDSYDQEELAFSEAQSPSSASWDGSYCPPDVRSPYTRDHSESSHATLRRASQVSVVAGPHRFRRLCPGFSPGFGIPELPPIPKRRAMDRPRFRRPFALSLVHTLEETAENYARHIHENVAWGMDPQPPTQTSVVAQVPVVCPIPTRLSQPSSRVPSPGSIEPLPPTLTSEYHFNYDADVPLLLQNPYPSQERREQQTLRHATPVQPTFLPSTHSARPLLTIALPSPTLMDDGAYIKEEPVGTPAPDCYESTSSHHNPISFRGMNEACAQSAPAAIHEYRHSLPHAYGWHGHRQSDNLPVSGSRSPMDPWLV
ncbi:hypothetical protein DL96DRAFT_1704624 [Flagelloscypha sp. PMI_526]|nr:hypothetical protein DL96DRAFT_1704624 [Flagelloscypha sp. PMI_526]